MSAITVAGVSKKFGTLLVLDDVSLAVAEGEVVSLVGPSGCGKTTLLRIVAGLEELSSGQVRVNGDSPKNACRKCQIGIAFQHPALVLSRTALQNVQLTLDIVGARNGNISPREILVDFGLCNFLGHFPHQLSGGMQQRVNIASALVHNPKVLLLDEPFGALDDLTRGELWGWLGRVLAATGQTVLFVTHSVEEAVMLSDRVAVFSPLPGEIADLVSIALPRPRKEGVRLERAFLSEVAAVRRSLNRALRRGDWDV